MASRPSTTSPAGGGDIGGKIYYTFSGVTVEFPHKAYPSQVAMMSKIVLSLKRGQNALLESPTGSGKSLALLCAALAWQRHESSPVDLSAADSPPTAASDDEDFMPSKRRRKSTGVERSGRTRIYFGTRTHKQVKQIVRELNKTAYKDTRMAILAGREHTCIHPVVSARPGCDEGCRELNDEKGGRGPGCKFRLGVKKLRNHEALLSKMDCPEGARAWDLEELVRVGREITACPFYASKELVASADLVICPYNYLIEPRIRDGMEISLAGSVVILDEAHNVEDFSRAAASWEITREQLRESMADLEKVETSAGLLAEEYGRLALICSNLCLYMDSEVNSNHDYEDSKTRVTVRFGSEVINSFNQLGVGPEQRWDMSKDLQRVRSDKEKEEKSNTKRKRQMISGATGRMFEDLIHVLHYLSYNQEKGRDDYRVAMVYKKIERGGKETGGNDTKGPGAASSIRGWLRDLSDIPNCQWRCDSLRFWCMSPAVGFEGLKDAVRCLVLTSGTLAPLASFSTELGVKFHQQLEASHVIDKRQVMICTVGQGPTGQSLTATFRASNAPSFQDELGLAIAEVCEALPHGILLFLPSYSLMDKLIVRWKTTDLWKRLEKRKRVVREPRSSEGFDACLETFSGAVEGWSGDVDGALLLAVCRGKVSEGLDFADNNARAVICVGIPFPNIKDPQVDQKQKYNNDTRIVQEELLTGSEWYEIQAFRALNQALGRCIRHRQDWGAILMIDSRFQRDPGRYIGRLSKWVRAGIWHSQSFGEVTEAVKKFKIDMSNGRSGEGDLSNP